MPSVCCSRFDFAFMAVGGVSFPSLEVEVVVVAVVFFIEGLEGIVADVDVAAAAVALTTGAEEERDIITLLFLLLLLLP